MEAGAIAVRRVRKEDMRHVAKATGATMVRLHSASVITYENLYVSKVHLHLEELSGFGQSNMNCMLLILYGILVLICEI